MPPTGKGKLPLLVVAEAPGRQEDERGIQLIGQAGQLLRGILSGLRVDLDRDCRKTNAVCCRPPDNRTPKPQEVEACRPLLEKEIGEFKPGVILALGGTALQGLWGDRLGDLAITKWRGLAVPDRKFGCWVCPTFHPSYVLREEKNAAVSLTFRRDVKNAFAMLDKPFPLSTPEEPKVKILTDTGEILKAVRCLKFVKRFYFDYETTGRKPHREEHSIICCAYSTDGESAWAFPMSDPDVRAAWSELMRLPSVGKAAHNLKFEDAWTRVKLRVRVRGWEWDTMLAAHVLDNRRGVTGLKFQAAAKFGVFGYNSKVDKFLESPLSREEALLGANGINQAKNCNMTDLMTYCGVDAMLGCRLMLSQMRELCII